MAEVLVQQQQQQQQQQAQPQQLQQVQRVLYTQCPLCGSKDMKPVGTAPCSQHPLYNPHLPPFMNWKSCNTCLHVFTDGYFDDAGFKILFSKSHPHQIASVEAAEQQRLISSRIVAKVSNLMDGPEGKWLDVGCGNGALFTTAAEFGYEATGVDVRQDAVANLKALGYDAVCVDFNKLDSTEMRYDVISMADVLEHMPSPPDALKICHQLLTDHGLLFLSMPNRDNFSWKVMDATGRNPYWGELEHFHNFDRKGLYVILKQHGFKPISYGVSERYCACMEVVARKVATP